MVDVAGDGEFAFMVVVRSFVRFRSARSGAGGWFNNEGAAPETVRHLKPSPIYGLHTILSAFDSKVRFKVSTPKCNSDLFRTARKAPFKTL
jgi:hypothetical protein